MRYIVKFEHLDDDTVKVFFHDKTEEIINIKLFNEYVNKGLVHMAFIIP